MNDTVKRIQNIGNGTRRWRATSSNDVGQTFFRGPMNALTPCLVLLEKYKLRMLFCPAAIHRNPN